MKSRFISFVILASLIACKDSRFQTYRSISLQVFDKKADEEKQEYVKQEERLQQDMEKIYEKKARGEKLSLAEFYDELLFKTQQQYPGTWSYKSHDINLPSSMNPRWIEVNEEYIIFRNQDKEEVKRFNITKTDKQEGIDNADWIFQIQDSEIEKAILMEHSLQLKSKKYMHYDYSYEFYVKEK